MENNKPGCLGEILKVFGLLPKNIEPVAEVFPYLKRDDFLSFAELSFLRKKS